MAITFETSNPSNLLSTFKRLIAARHVQTWSCDADGDFTHTPDQWRNKAFLRPSVQSGRLVFTMLGNTRVVTTWEIYAVYQGRFIEAMISHCHDSFSTAAATANPSTSDQLTSRVA